ncbi:MAG TPA: D-alanyl-D-alanine carboxypeptidase/D-alanyl-D-alanine-endopeptidase [Stackebrandtia sp.]|uniref:D-alanyl-D-alanine carboxypeptidase/D-alanyl-D-alanine endopeptidase n=1 Tax=Stackebrandtia sp. TaxID=2023065 RepID=UPI002D59EE59|nr:D-alanyl-D-alanine carboxypeptidase/D-alanyl-D-alanine-endopeptidase [Stackebrandtia sp.]HZE40527.1 D-alanyl-D-alanine carboxypeptidase/D-alanyl-D-alanine-endopeptidase [Stackebrandtia sp.]
MKTLTRVTAAAFCLALAAAVASAAPASAKDDDGPLGEAIDKILAAQSLQGSQADVVVSDAKTGDVIYDHNGDGRAIPASLTKTLTSTAAMDTLGPDFTFTTDVASTGTVRHHTLAADAYLRGTGDPTMLAADYDKLAKSLADKGIKRIDGDLVADDTAYDDTRLGLEWAWDDEPYYYAAPVSALTIAADDDYDAGSVVVTVKPGASEGDKPKVSFSTPSGYLKVDNRATTAAKGADSTLGVDRTHGGNTFVISGQIPVGADPDQEWMAVWEPTGYATAVFRSALRDHGITVSGHTRLGKPTPSGAKSLATHDSMPLSKLLVPFLKLSNNSHAETLAKAIGRKVSGKGTWSAGLKQIRSYASQHGVDTKTLIQADGSGESRRNFIPAKAFNDLLVGVRSEPWFDTWYNALPIACHSDRLDGGTLRSRMCDTPAEGNVHAKTGSMTGVNSLGGYVTDADGRQLVFSIVLNDLVDDAVTGIQDSIAVTLASYKRGDAASVRELGKIPQPKRHAPNGLECSWVKPIVC